VKQNIILQEYPHAKKLSLPTRHRARETFYMTDSFVCCPGLTILFRDDVEKAYLRRYYDNMNHTILFWETKTHKPDNPGGVNEEQTEWELLGYDVLEFVLKNGAIQRWDWFLLPKSRYENNPHMTWEILSYFWRSERDLEFYERVIDTIVWD
jgi:hypothetical protein